MTDVHVGMVRIEAANNYGPDGRRPIAWVVKVDFGDYSGRLDLSERGLLELAIALEAWRKANAR